MSNKLPVYSIASFQNQLDTNEFYANNFSNHVQNHHFTNLPHKHDFYLVVLITKGSGWHEVDFVRYTIEKGSVFMLQPGQMHYWELSSDIDGFVFFHTKTFFDEVYTTFKINNFPFFNSFYSNTEFSVSNDKLNRLTVLMKELITETQLPAYFSKQKIHALLNLVYIEFSRGFIQENKTIQSAYLNKLLSFENAIELNYKNEKSVQFYANKLNISSKHLNRIVKESLNKTSSDLIAERVILEAKHMLIQLKFNVTQIGYELGYHDKSYFVRFFKKQTGETPMNFLNNYQK
jgi:AraC-like DNA-binding protein